MHLKRIEIAGFKSFADRTKIEFDQGLTAVVGPNGSGKSNITEALRWVLGEQSAKNLRGGRMPDIIFAGSDTRKQLNLAEVTVVLDNQDHYLPLDFSEVSITRRYSRSGDSEFYINKQNCRLKDIVDLFMDSGLGKESFSIISQGKVEAIFNSKPEDRRGIFEEAAGVLKYKQRKNKAEQKLFETEDNLNRIQDIIYELEGQLLPLEEQSQAAKTYVKLKEEYVQLDVGVNVQEIDGMKMQWQQKNVEVQHLAEKMTQSQHKIADLEEQMVILREESQQLDHNIDKNQNKLLHVTEAYEKAEGHKKVLVERTKNTQQNTKEYQQTIEQYVQKMKEIQTEIQELNSKKVEKKQELTMIEEGINHLKQEVEKYSLSAKERMADLRSQYVEVMQQQANVSNDLKHLTRQYQQETNKNQQVMSRHQELNTNQQVIMEQENNLKEKVAANATLLESLRENFRIQQQTSEEAKEILTKNEKQMYAAMGILQQAKARRKSLQELQENHAGFYQGVREVLNASTNQELEDIVGVVAELIQVPSIYTLAVETALGAAAQHIIVENEQAGRSGIEFLKKNRLGRATFLPLTTVKSRSIPEAVKKDLTQVQGFMGIASDVLDYPPKIKAIVNNLLGVTILARTLQSANQLAKQVNYRYRVVSLEGDIMNPGGSMTGGANKKGNKGNVFAQANELQTLNDQVKEMEQELQRYEQKVQQLKQQVLESQNKLEFVRDEGEKARFAEQELKNKMELIDSQSLQIKKEQRAFEYETKELQQFLTEYAQKKEELEGKQETLNQLRASLDQEMNQTDQEETSNTDKREAAQNQLNKRLSDQAVIQEQFSHIETQLNEKQLGYAELEGEHERVVQQLSLLNSNTVEHSETQDSLAGKMAQLTLEKNILQEQLLHEKEQRDQLQQETTKQEETLATANRQQQQLLAEKSKAEVAQNRAEVSLDNALQYLQEEYNLTYEASKQRYSLIIDIDSAKKQVTELKRKIESLGVVNLGAIEQYEQVLERYEFLTTQREDLLQAKSSLFDTMNEMDEEVKIRFAEVFKAIGEKFQVVFPSMFGGGHAELRLTDPQDLLNTGVEIVAQPPGKKLQSLSLLSGGERALTAIALLFSIIQVRPVPFCVLDEVEAALDEANVARFGSYLSKFETHTQFIVITHRKGTMEAADVLYGVTMQESGISRIVSVRLEDVNERGNIQPSVS